MSCFCGLTKTKYPVHFLTFSKLSFTVTFTLGAQHSPSPHNCRHGSLGWWLHPPVILPFGLGSKMHISVVSPSAGPWGLAVLWPCHPAIWPCEYLFHFVHIMASTCRKYKKSMILPVPVDLFTEFLHICLCSHYTRHPFQMNRKTLFTCEFRKEYEYHVWEEMCMSPTHRWNFGMDHHC